MAFYPGLCRGIQGRQFPRCACCPTHPLAAVPVEFCTVFTALLTASAGNGGSVAGPLFTPRGLRAACLIALLAGPWFLEKAETGAAAARARPRGRCPPVAAIQTPMDETNNRALPPPRERRGREKGRGTERSRCFCCEAAFFRCAGAFMLRACRQCKPRRRRRLALVARLLASPLREGGRAVRVRVKGEGPSCFKVHGVGSKLFHMATAGRSNSIAQRHKA